MMRRFVVAVAIGVLLPSFAVAQGTKLWSVERYDELEKGSAEGVAIRSDGRLEAGPENLLLYATGGSYVWSLTSDGRGTAYVGMGGTASGSAAVMRVSVSGTARDDSATKIFAGKELAVQALRVLADGSVLAATSPDGKVYRIAAGAGVGTVPAVVFDPAMTAEKPKYLWDLVVGKGGEIFVATGAPAVVYRVPAGGGKAEVLFKTGDQHIRCLLLGPDGTLWAGSDGAGVIYKFTTGTPGAKPFAAYVATRREITTLTMDAAGNVYAAGVGAKGGTGFGVGLPPLPVTGAVGMTVTFSQAGSASAAGTNALVPDGTEIYKVGVDGAPARLLTLKDDVVYALTVRNGSLLAATGNRGRVYKVETDGSGRFTDLAHLEASQGMTFAAVSGGLLVGTSNSGKVFRLGDAVAKDATYTSEVFDSQGFSQWGRTEVRGTGATDLYIRSGNVPSALMGWSAWSRVGMEGAVVVPAARFVQWKAVLDATGGPGRSLDSVGLNYLPKNVAPVVDEIVVQAGARVAVGGGTPASTTVQVGFPAAGGLAPMVSFMPDAGSAPLTAQKDKTAITLRWLAHDENGDELMFAVWYRGVGETNWRLLKDKVSDRFYSFDSGLLPDGSYLMKVVASDAPVHADAEALTGERVSAVFVVDTTPPVPGALVAEMVAGSAGTAPAAKIHARFEARDAVSPISHADYSVDAGPWQYLEPVGKVSDSLMERYDFLAAIPTVTAPVTDAKEHVIAVRVYDRYENVVTVKAVVR